MDSSKSYFASAKLWITKEAALCLALPRSFHSLAMTIKKAESKKVDSGVWEYKIGGYQALEISSKISCLLLSLNDS
ncbi:hypothetical protein [Helicobacter canis]|uniref:hypothetical protein n=1 Tax=Helicobacter canis TaxID=29419 RepID=UPI0011C08340|nr:hypothetical protein [Helicobacter canis]